MMVVAIVSGAFACLWVGYEIGRVEGRVEGEFNRRMKEPFFEKERGDGRE